MYDFTLPEDLSALRYNLNDVVQQVREKMRPEVLFTLFHPVTALKGVGPRLGKLIEKLTGVHLVNLLWHLPVGIIDRRYAPKICDAEPGVIATITIKVEAHRKPPKKNLPYKNNLIVVSPNIVGVFNLLECFKEFSKKHKSKLIHI